jgi:hypothetical protein
MSYRSNLIALFMITLSLCACSSKEVVVADKPIPSRMQQATFKAMTLAQSKNSLMGACSQNHLQIQTTHNEVLCFQSEVKGTRFREIERVVNDEYATKIQVVMQFKLQESNSDVTVFANTYAQYLAPVSLTSGLQTRTRNLLDDISFNAIQAMLTEAGATN